MDAGNARDVESDPVNRMAASSYQREMTNASRATVTVPAAGPKRRADVKTKVSETDMVAGTDGSFTVAEPLKSVRMASTTQFQPSGSLYSASTDWASVAAPNAATTMTYVRPVDDRRSINGSSRYNSYVVTACAELREKLCAPGDDCHESAPIIKVMAKGDATLASLGSQRCCPRRECRRRQSFPKPRCPRPPQIGCPTPGCRHRLSFPQTKMSPSEVFAAQASRLISAKEGRRGAPDENVPQAGVALPQTRIFPQTKMFPQTRMSEVTCDGRAVSAFPHTRMSNAFVRALPSCRN